MEKRERDNYIDNCAMENTAVLASVAPTIDRAITCAIALLARHSYLFKIVLVQAQHLQATHVLERLFRQFRPAAVDATELNQVGLVQEGSVQALGYGVIAQIE